MHISCSSVFSRGWCYLCEFSFCLSTLVLFVVVFCVVFFLLCLWVVREHVCDNIMCPFASITTQNYFTTAFDYSHSIDISIVFKPTPTALVDFESAFDLFMLHATFQSTRSIKVYICSLLLRPQEKTTSSDSVWFPMINEVSRIISALQCFSITVDVSIETGSLQGELMAQALASTCTVCYVLIEGWWNAMIPSGM